MIKVSAYAKINLTLEVLGRREDGYHNIVSVLQEIDLKDSLQFESASSLTVDCDNVKLRPSDNLALKAARLLKKESRYKGGARITLRKNIPIAAGLGGGSSDAAATLVALNELWRLDLSAGALMELASMLGSDVPFFIRGGAALAGGRGESITPLPALPQSWVVLLKPSVQVPASKTKAMYGALHPSHYSRGEHTKKAVSAVESMVEEHQSPVSHDVHLSFSDLIILPRKDRTGEAISPLRPDHPSKPSKNDDTGGRSQSFRGRTVRKNRAPLFQGYNAFDSIAFDMYEGMEWYWKQFMAAGAVEVHLAGSGPTLFAPMRDRARAGKVHRSLKELGLETYLVRTVARTN